jgi:TolB-like protein
MADSDSFFGNLQRRHVIRAGVAHIVLFWLLIQVADVVLPYLGVVDEPVRWALVIAIATFPITLIVAWFFEHPFHNFTSSRLAIDGIVIIVIAVTAGMWVVRNLPQVVHTRTSVVILPFANSGDPLDQSLSRAMAYEINALLMKSKSIDVTGVESAMSSVLAGLTEPQIAERLNVQHVLEGTIATTGDDMLVEVALLDRAGRQLWRSAINDKLENLFAVQESIAAEIQMQLGAGDDAIDVKTVAANRCWMPSDANALERYYTARTYIELRTEGAQSNEQVRSAIAFYRELIEEYPEFAEAYSGLAWAIMHQAAYDPENALEDSQPTAIALARQAFEHCPTLGEALNLLPNQYDHENGWIGQYQQLTAFLEMEPHKLEYYQRLSRHYAESGLVDKGYAMARKNYALDPLSPRAVKQLAGALQFRGEYDEAIELFELAEELGSAAPNWARLEREFYSCDISDIECKVNVYPMPEEVREMLRVLMQPPENDEQRQASIDLATQMLRMNPHEVTNSMNAMACDYDHMTPIFFEAWEISNELGSYWFWPNVWRSSCGNVWSAPEFPDFVAEAGLVEYWRQVGWPAMCRPEGETVVCGEL